MNLVKEFLLLKAKVDKLYCQLIAKGSDEQDPTVPNHVKNIKQEDINNWNKVKDTEDVKVQITENNHFAEIGQNQKDFNKNVSDYKVIIDNKNIEQDERLENIEGDNTAQYDLINDLFSELQSEKTRNDIQDNVLNNLEGIYYVWSPTNRTLTLYDREGTQLSQVSLVSLDNEGTDLRYNASTLSLELYNKDNELLDSIPVSSFIGSVGTQLQLNSNQLQLKDSQGNILSTVTFEVSNISGLQTALDSKQDVLTEDNLGQFMDSELPTKSAPTSGDTVLGRDSVTGKAVKIPTNQLGNNIDLSNFVPYDNATKDVNIASNYFKTSKGFDYTFDGNNYFRTFHNGLYNQFEFNSNSSEFGGLKINSNVEEGFSIDKIDGLNRINFGIGSFGMQFFADLNGENKNIFSVSQSDTYSKQPYVTDSGFRIINGTPNLSLTADGGTFDLNTKADLVDGKVPKAQSQPSTIVMNNSTYVITFTDATGAVQTIDLPLETLFQDANYDETTKSLIVTLQDGTTRTIPLSDLVDLPEIVLATTNPAVTPTSGQKVWFNTFLGKVWFNVSEVWTYAGNLMTDAEKVKLAKTSGTNTGDETNSTILSKIGYTPENTLNKSSDVLADKASSIKYPTVKSVYDYVQPEFNSRLKSYAYDSLSAFPIGIQIDAFFIDRELGDVYIGWTDPNYLGDPGLPGGTYYKKIGLDINTTDLVFYYNKNESDLRYLPIKANSSTGTLISFTTDKVYGTLATPETGNITADVTNAKLGVTNIIIHNSGTAPTFESAFKKLSGSGNYITGVVNYIYCTYISTTEIIYSINQRT